MAMMRAAGAVGARANSADSEEKPKDVFKIWQRIVGYTARKYKRYLALAFFGIVATQFLAVLIPRILRDVIDIGVARQDGDYMLQAGLLVLGLGILRGLFGFLGRYFSEMQSHRVAYDIRNEFYDKVQRLPFAYHDTAQTGSLITRGISDVDEIQRYLAFGLIDGLNTLMIVFFAIAALTIEQADPTAV